jgi:hypothetical protein
MRLGVFVFGLMPIATGIVDLVWGNFDPGHEPIQAFGDHIPGQRLFAYIIAVLLIAAGAAVLSKRAVKAGAAALGAIYLIFVLFNFPRFYTAPHYLGFHVAVFAGVLVGVFQELILVAAAMLIYAWHRTTRRCEQRLSAGGSSDWVASISGSRI